MAESGSAPSAPAPSPPAPAAGAPAPAPVPSAGAPSPAVFARRKATALVLPGADAIDEVPFDPEVGVTAELVDSVAKQLVASWCATSTPAQLAALRDQRPAIPAELDRALLVDLASRSQGAHLADEARQHLRDRFWVHVGRVRME